MSKTMTFLRKYQKVVFSVLCVVLIVTWGLSYSADQLMSWGSGGRAKDPGAEVVVTWVGGKLTYRDLEHRRRNRLLVGRYVGAVMQKGQEAGGRPTFPIFLEDGFSPLSPGTDTRTALEVMLRAEQARRMGVVVSEEAVKDFLIRVGGNKLTEGDLGLIAREVLGQEMSDERLVEQLQEELLSQHLRLLTVGSVSGGGGLRGESLGDDWEYFNRLHRRVTIEAFPLEVAKFVDEVRGEPSPKELRELFDKYKDHDPDPNQPEPGFRNLKRIAWEHVKFDFAPYLEKSQKLITDEQIEKRYEEGISKGEFKEAPKKEEEEKKEDGEKKEGTPDKKDGDEPEKKDGDKKDADEKEGADPKPEEKPSDPVTPGDPSAKKAAPQKPAETKPTETKPTETKPAEKPAAEKPEKPAAEKPGDKPAEEKPGEEKPGEEKPAEEKPKEPVKYKPLSEVRDQIIKELAQPLAQADLTKDRQQIIAALKEYAKKRMKWEVAQKTSKGKVSEPEDLDIASLAKKLGLKHETTPLYNRYEIEQEEIGRNGYLYVPRGEPIPFANLGYSSGRNTLFERITLEQPQNLGFFARFAELFTGVRDQSDPLDRGWEVWAVKQETPTDAKFEDKEVQERVRQAWRKQQALVLAQKEAESLAARAENKMTLQEVAPDGVTALKPPAFSWLTSGALSAAQGGMPQLSPVQGIDRAGPEFMEAVTHLKLNETGIALNASHSLVYVVRVLEEQPTEDELRTLFLESGASRPVKTVAMLDAYRLGSEWKDELARNLKVVYHRSLAAPEMAEE